MNKEIDIITNNINNSFDGLLGEFLRLTDEYEKTLKTLTRVSSRYKEINKKREAYILIYFSIKDLKNKINIIDKK
tara:strand:+ start:723 stop:947 length:225 start_codon:yes stop_codon:yes gene_type:complete